MADDAPPPPHSAAGAQTTAPSAPPQPQPPTRNSLHFPSSLAAPLSPYLPPSTSSPPQTTNPQSPHSTRPFTTLTFATSLDSSLSLAPGVRTALSGPLSKAMTHHLRSRHDAILIGAGTAMADDPSLNCRVEGVGGYGGVGLEGQPRPVVLDARARWKGIAQVLQLAQQGAGRAPWILIDSSSLPRIPASAIALLEAAGGRVITLPVSPDNSFAWPSILALLARHGIRSVMIEGGAGVINKLLEPASSGLVDSIVVTIAPTWLGRGGVVVCPERGGEEEEGEGEKKGMGMGVARLRDVRWTPMGEDVVLCGRLGGR
ncbi:dihydrofolate reductase-like domain-containing protein [Phyllosticta capitalensis]|uniref:2,5-diamino-6-ribosylamino-4(3H)-pyrimidinone 5'-phosphate reductase n=1 Tax=Phyllosticta capitalensis TaxID=121624 RepID=A0ABR1Z109_9PEZI